MALQRLANDFYFILNIPLGGGTLRFHYSKWLAIAAASRCCATNRNGKPHTLWSGRRGEKGRQGSEGERERERESQCWLHRTPTNTQAWLPQL